jgi:hypothetical protein
MQYLPYVCEQPISQPGDMLAATKVGVCAIANTFLPSCPPAESRSVKLEQLDLLVCADLYSREWTGSMLRQLTSDEHLDYIAALLDDMFRIPGTQIRFGLDALIGWVPGIGDAMAGIASFLIVFASWRRGAKAVTLVRMIANVLLETTIGAIPVAGDVFHVFWKANRRNYRLLMREKEQPCANTRRDWMFLAIILFTAIAAVGIPIVILIWILWPYLQWNR